MILLTNPVPIEIEVHSIIEALKYWKHFPEGHFILKTDQKSVSYMCNKHHKGKIKNKKFLC